MAVQTIDILLKIKEVGLNALDELVEKLGQVRDALGATEVGPMGDVAVQAERIGKAFETTAGIIANIDKTTGRIEDTIRRVIRKIAKDAVDVATSSLGRIRDEADVSIESLYTKMALTGAILGGLGIGLFFESSTVAIVHFLNETTTLVGTFRFFFNFFDIELRNLFSLFEVGRGILQGFFATGLSGGGGLLGLFVKLSVGWGTFTAGLFLAKTFFGEITLLGRRLVGLGNKGLTPIQRAVRLMTTLDLLLADIGFKTGQIAKSLTFMGATIGGFILNPLLGAAGALATINTLVDVVLNIGLRFRLKVFSFFGDARSQARLIFLDLKNLLATILPLALDLVKNFGKMFKAKGQKGFVEVFARFGITLDQLINILAQMLSLVKQLGGASALQIKKAESDAISAIGNIDAKTKGLLKQAGIGFSKLGAFVKGAFAGIGKGLLAILKSPFTIPRAGTRGLAEVERRAGVKPKAAPQETAQIKANVEATKQEIKVREKVLAMGREEVKASTQLASAAKARETVQKSANAALKKTVEQTKVTAKALDEIILKALASGKTLSKGLSCIFLHFGDIVKRSLTEPIGKVDVELKNTFRSMFKNMQELALKTKAGLSSMSGIAQKIGPSFRKGLVIDPAKAKAALAPLEQKLQELKKTGAIVGKDTGGLIVSMLSRGMKNNRAEAEKAAALLAKLIASYYPQSLPKKGALRNLVKMGMLIPFYLARGIKQAFGVIQSVIGKMVGQITNPLTKITEIGLIAEAFGVSVETLSSLDYALSSVGATASDLNIVFTRLNTTLAKDLTSEDLEKFASLGVDIERAKKAQEPALNLLLQLSDAMKDLTPGTAAWKDALELLGVVGMSKLIPLLKKGSAEIQKLQSEGNKLGVVFGKDFAESAIKVKGLVAQLGKVKDSIILDIIEPLLPDIQNFFLSIKQFIADNRVTIEASIRFTLSLLRGLLDIIGEFVVLAFKQPEKSVAILKTFFTEFGIFLLNSLDQVFRGTQIHVLNLVGALFSIVSKVSMAVMKVLFVNLSLLAIAQINTLFADMLRTVTQKLTDLPDDAVFAFNLVIPGFKKGIEALDTINNLMAGELQKNAEAIKKKMVDMGATVKKTLTELKPEFEAVKESAKDLIVAMADNKPLEVFAENFKASIERMESAVAGTELEGPTSNLKKMFEVGSYDDILNAVKAVQEAREQAIKEASEKAKNEINKVTDKLKNMGDVTRKMAESVARSIESMFLKITESLKQTITGQQRIFEIQLIEQQAKDLAEYEKHVKDKANVNFLINNFIMGQTFQREKLLYDNLLQLQREKAQNELNVQIEIANLKAKLSKDDEDIETAKMLEFQAAQESKLQSLIEAGATKSEQEDFFRLQAQEKEVAHQQILREICERATKAWVDSFQMIGQASSDIGTMFSDLYEMSSKSVKEFFYLSKAAAMGSAIMNIAQGITKAIGAEGFAGIAKGAIIAAMGTIQLAKIAAQTLGYQEGGPVPGQHLGRDYQLAALDGGEYVHPYDVVRHYGLGFMESLRQKAIPRDILTPLAVNLSPLVPRVPRYQAGGFVPTTASETSEQIGDQAVPNIQIINVEDQHALEQQLMSTPGEQAMLNFMANKSAEINGLLQG